MANLLPELQQSQPANLVSELRKQEDFISIKLPSGQAATFPTGMTPDQIRFESRKVYGEEPQDLGGITNPNIPVVSSSAESLPEIGEAPALNQLSLGSLKSGIAASLISDEFELGNALVSQIEGSRLIQDDQGRAILDIPDQGQFAINKPGISAQDINQLVTRMLSFGLGGTARGLGAKQLARETARIGGIEAGLQGVESTVGGEFDSSQVGIAAATAPLGQFVGEKFLPVTIERVKGLIKTPQKLAAQKLLSESAPSSDLLRAVSRGIYDQVDDIGARVRPNVYRPFLNRLKGTLSREGFDQDITPKAAGLINRIKRELDKDIIKASDVETFRRVAQNLAQEGGSEGRLGAIALDKIDDFMANMGPNSFFGGKNVRIDGQPLSQALKDARSLWGRAKRSEEVRKAIDLAFTRRAGGDLALRNEFANLDRKIIRGTLRGFSEAEKQAIKSVAKGNFYRNMATNLGRLGIPEDQATNSLMLSIAGLGGGGIGFAAGGVPGAVAGTTAAISVPSVFRRLGSKATEKSAELADAVVRSGGDAMKIAQSYLKATPKDQRNVGELTGLLLNAGAEVSELTAKNEFIDNALFFAQEIAKRGVPAQASSGGQDGL